MAYPVSRRRDTSKESSFGANLPITDHRFQSALPVPRSLAEQPGANGPSDTRKSEEGGEARHQDDGDHQGKAGGRHQLLNRLLGARIGITRRRLLDNLLQQLAKVTTATGNQQLQPKKDSKNTESE